jgi:hypothetical protein
MKIALLLTCLLLLMTPSGPVNAQSMSAPVANKNMPEVLLYIVADKATWKIEKVHCRQFPDLSTWVSPDAFCPFLGFTQVETHTVYVLKGMTKDDEKSTVLHEVMHVAVGTDRSNEKTTIHGAIYVISEHLVDILANNPQLSRYLSQ